MDEYFFNTFKQENGWRIDFEFKNNFKDHIVIFTLKETSKLHSTLLNEIPLVKASFSSQSKSNAPDKELFKSKHYNRIFMLPREGTDKELIQTVRRSHKIVKFPYFPKNLTFIKFNSGN